MGLAVLNFAKTGSSYTGTKLEKSGSIKFQEVAPSIPVNIFAEGMPSLKNFKAKLGLKFPSGGLLVSCYVFIENLIIP